MTDKGTCKKHGEFILAEGCQECIQEERERREAEALGEEIPVEEPVAETALALRPGEDVDTISYYGEALKLLDYAELRNIVNFEDLTLANDDLSLISKVKKAMEGKRKAYLEPLKAQTEAIRDTYNYLMAPVLKADRITRDKMLAFNQEQERRRLEQEEINRKKIELAEAEMKLKGELSQPVDLVEVTPESAKKVSTDLGTSGQTDHWIYEVFDFALLPDEYKVADSAMLNSIAKKHHDNKQIPGVRFFNEPYIANRPR